MPRPRVVSRSAPVPLALLLAALALGAGPSPAAPAAQPGSGADERRWQRVAGLCEAWTAAKYVHPRLWGSELDWDAAFVEAAVAVDGASTAETYRAIAGGMFARLEDPATEVVAEEAAGSPAAAAPAPPADAPLVRELEPGVLLFDLPAAFRARGRWPVVAELEQAFGERLPGARGAILDLRFGEEGPWQAVFALEELAPHLVPRPVLTPVERWIVHWGYAPQLGATSGGYRSGLVSSAARELRPAGQGGDWRIVLLLDEDGLLGETLLALHGAGLARLVSEGPFDPGKGAPRVAVELGEGLSAWVRVAELVSPGGLPVAAAAEVAPRAPGGEDHAVAAARRLLAEPWPEPAAPAATAAAPVVRQREATYAEPSLPSPGHRLLAGCRAWGVIRHFYPYLDLIGDWDGAFRASLPELWAAADEPAYARAVLRLMAHVADGHTSVWGHPAIAEVLGAAGAPIATRLVEGQVAIHDFDPALEGVRRGDVVRTVDGEPIEARIERFLPLVPGSTETTRRQRASRHALAGPPGSTVVLELAGEDGTRRVELTRGSGWRPAPGDGPAWRRLTPAIGYVDLRRLQVAEVDTMLEELRTTRALVFDMRGYPNGTAWALAPRLNRRGAKVAALFRRRELSGESLGADSVETGYFFSQPLPPADPGDWIYEGETVMLVDERAISQAEHTGLFLEAAAGTEFVGEPTAGANGDVTVFSLPGGMWVGFTGHDVRHADGRQLQRVGLQPHVPVAPTLAGLRAGRDEVLERALAHLEAKLAAAAPAP